MISTVRVALVSLDIIISLHSSRRVTKTVTKVKVRTNPEKLSKHHMTGKAEGQMLPVLESTWRCYHKRYGIYCVCHSLQSNTLSRTQGYKKLMRQVSLLY